MAGDCYVYEHWNPETDQCFYVGAGRKFRAYDQGRRSAEHWQIVESLLRCGKTIQIKIVASCLTESASFKLEAERISHWRALGINLINKTNGGKGPSGFKFSEESRQRMSSSKKGQKRSAETKAKISASKKGKNLSAETRSKISAAHTGKIQGPHSEEHKAKIGAARKGKKDSAEVRENKRKAALARPPQSQEVRDHIAAKMRERWADKEYRAHMSEAHKAYEFTEEHRASLREAMAKRPPRSEEHKAKIAASIREHWATKRRKAG